MKIAVTYENEQVYQHFGHSKQFKLYDVADGKVVSAEVVDTKGVGHGDLAMFLKKHGADTLICGGIGGGAKTALTESGIHIFPGVSGEANKQVENLLNECLDYNPEVQCSHHGGDHKCHGHK